MLSRCLLLQYSFSCQAIISFIFNKKSELWDLITFAKWWVQIDTKYMKTELTGEVKEGDFVEKSDQQETVYRTKKT